MNPDFSDMLSALSEAGVDFLTAVGRPKDLADMALLDEADGLDR